MSVCPESMTEAEIEFFFLKNPFVLDSHHNYCIIRLVARIQSTI